MKKTKKLAFGGYTQKPTGPAKPMGPIMGPKSTDGSGVMSGLRSMASSLKPNMVTEKPNMGPNASTNQIQRSPVKGFSADFDPTKPRPVSSGKLYPLQGSISPVKGPAATPFKFTQGMNPNFKPGEGPKYTGPGVNPKYTGPGFGPKGPTATPVGPKPQIMGGSSNKMGPDSMKRGVPSNPANMSIAKPPGLTGAGVTKFTGPPSIKTAKNFEGYTTPGVEKFKGPMSTGPRYDKPSKPLTTPTSNPNVLKFNGPMVQSRLKAGGAVKASKRGDGIAQRGKTKCRMVQ